PGTSPKRRDSFNNLTRRRGTFAGPGCGKTSGACGRGGRWQRPRGAEDAASVPHGQAEATFPLLVSALQSAPVSVRRRRRDVLSLDPNKELHSWDPAGKVKGIDTVYGLAFHPQFAQNRTCYVCYALHSKKPGEQLPDGSRVSRFRVTDTDPPRIDPKSEKVLL